jgi:hypothetical protein
MQLQNLLLSIFPPLTHQNLFTISAELHCYIALQVHTLTVHLHSTTPYDVYIHLNLATIMISQPGQSLEPRTLVSINSKSGPILYLWSTELSARDKIPQYYQNT